MCSEELFNEILRKVSKWSSMGANSLSNGVRLICPTPALGPKAWLHVIFAPLAPETIMDVARTLRVSLPNDFAKFLRLANGLMLFNYRISVWGVRTSMVRLGGDESWQPQDLADQNFETMRPDGSPEDIVFFGGSDDGETWCFFESDGDGYRVGKTNRHRFDTIAYWPDFGSWLLSEIESLETLFDADGVMRVKR